MTRLVDIVAATAGLLLLSPLLALIAVLVRSHDGGPVFYRALRVGRYGRPFRLYKFRTMRVGADKGHALTRGGDDRVTGVGRWLRRTKLDELPQLLNVVRGDMGLVGPRPEDPRYVELYSDAQRRVLDARPGITGAASVLYRSEEEILVGADFEALYKETVMPAKLAIDLEYLSRRTPWTDAKIILKTLAALLR